jgi:signal transduction histidine kinase
MKPDIHALIVEDDPDNAELMRSLLEQEGEGMRFLSERVELLDPALARLAKGGIDVVLLDLMLPDSRGLETVEAVHQAHPGLPIVVMTGINDEEMALEAVRRGAQDFLVKGTFNAQLLRRCLRYAIERVRLGMGLADILRSSADAMVVVVDGKVAFANPAAEALFGRPSSQMVGEPFELPPSPRTHAELRLVGAAGRPRDVEMRVAEMPWRDGTARLASLRDVTRLKRLERLRAEIGERRKTQRLREQFVYKVSHEIRSPLTVVRGAVSNLRDGLAGPLGPGQTDAVRMADRNLARAIRILNSLLDLARLESGQAEVSRQPEDLAPLLREAAEDFRAAHGDGKLTLEAEVPESLPTVLADRDMLQQVVVNILENAARFARGRIRLSARVVREGDADEVRVAVQDDGPGIAPEDASRVFDKYTQLPRKAEKSGGYRGAGLGLAICRETLELHGGRIWAEAAPGEGARFEFAVPVADKVPLGRPI